VLLATGLVDEPPPIPGLAELWRTSVPHCPYCDAFEVADQPLAVLGSDARTAQLALQLTRFSADVVLCTNGAADLDLDVWVPETSVVPLELQVLPRSHRAAMIGT
jgi:thioredoxin reductase